MRIVYSHRHMTESGRRTVSQNKRRYRVSSYPDNVTGKILGLTQVSIWRDSSDKYACPGVLARLEECLGISLTRIDTSFCIRFRSRRRVTTCFLCFHGISGLNDRNCGKSRKHMTENDKNQYQGTPLLTWGLWNRTPVSRSFISIIRFVLFDLP